MSGPTLGDLLIGRAEEMDDVAVAPGPDGHEISVGGIAVAVVDAAAAQFRVRVEVAAAALRTPDVTSAGRGPGWVRFAPAALDDHARDRALAWLESSVRLALEGDGSA